MAKKLSPRTKKLIKQIILLALPLILQALKKNKANAKAGPGVRVTDRPPTLPPPGAKPTKAKKRESHAALPEPPTRRAAH